MVKEEMGIKAQKKRGKWRLEIPKEVGKMQVGTQKKVLAYEIEGLGDDREEVTGWGVGASMLRFSLFIVVK